MNSFAAGSVKARSMSVLDFSRCPGSCGKSWKASWRLPIRVTWRASTRSPQRREREAMGTARPRLLFTLLVLLGINTMNFYDRQVLGAVAEPLKHELRLSDAELGFLGSAFIYLYAVVGIPLGYWADVGRRKTILAAGATVWSLLTSLSGFAGNFASLFALRLG